jgi:hypothetical protein
MLTIIGLLALALVVCALLAWALNCFAPFAAGAIGVIALNIPDAHWSVQFTAMGLTFVCFVVSCINQHNAQEGSAQTDAQKRSESRADQYAIYAVLLAVFYTAGAWLWQLLHLSEFFTWFWKAGLKLDLNLRAPIIAVLVLVYVTYRLVRRARRRRANRSTTPASPTPAPAANLSSVS